MTMFYQLAKTILVFPSNLYFLQFVNLAHSTCSDAGGFPVCECNPGFEWDGTNCNGMSFIYYLVYTNKNILFSFYHISSRCSLRQFSYEKHIFYKLFLTYR